MCGRFTIPVGLVTIPVGLVTIPVGLGVSQTNRVIKDLNEYGIDTIGT